MEQLEMFANIELVPYWQSRLRRWPGEVYEWRHARWATGWSMATQGLHFAEYLHEAGFLGAADLARYRRFDRRVQRWDERTTI